MTISFNDLNQHLPNTPIAVNARASVDLDFGQMVGETLTLDSSLIKTTAMFMDGLAALTTAINQQRASQTPPLAPISFVTKTLVGTPDKPEYHYLVDIAVDSSSYIQHLIDPTS